MIKLTLFPALLLSFIAINAQQDPAQQVIEVVKCNDFKVTGDGSSSEWNKSTWVNLNSNQTDDLRKTKFRIMYSGKGIYCLYESADTKITATLKGDNLDLFNEDVIEAFFWADESMPVYFEYELSPLNYELILMVPNYEGKFLGWIPWHYEGDRLTQHAVKTEDPKEGAILWRGEFFIPFELMKPMVQKAPSSGDKWRANFYRIDYDTKDPVYWMWMPVGSTFHEFKKFGTIQFE